MAQSSTFAGRPEVSLIIPVYRGAQHLQHALTEAISYLSERYGDAYEIIPVLDGVEDESDEVAATFAARCPRVRPLMIGHRGKGAAVAAGMLAARGEYVLFTDVDLATPLTEIPRAVAALQTADGVVGSREIAGAVRAIPQPVHRRLAGWVFRTMTRLLTGLTYRDTQCGFKGFRREVARALFTGLTTDGFAFDVEVLLRARHAGYRMVELPVTWYDQPGSTVRVVRDSARMAKELLRLGRHEPVQEFARFALVGAANTLVDLAALNFLLIIFAPAGTAGLLGANSAAFLLAVAHSYYWNRRWTFSRRGSFTGFLTVTFLGLQVNNLAVLGLGAMGLGLVTAKLGASVLTMGWNFLSSRAWVFRPGHARKAADNPT